MGLPVPPADIRYRIASSDYSAEDFLQHGAEVHAELTARTARAGVVPQRVLDWGCGCGRVLRHFIEQDDCASFGIDTDAVGIEWAQQNLPGATFRVNDRLPPAPFDDERFDLIYGISVLTHIDLDSQVRWLGELRRLSAPGAIAVLTTIGEAGFEFLRPHIPEAAAAEFARDGHTFFRNFDDGVLPDWYQSTLHSGAFARRLLTEHLGEVIESGPKVFSPEFAPHDFHTVRVAV